jgi:hypothetical protein
MELTDRRVLNLEKAATSPRVARAAVRAYTIERGFDGAVVDAALLVTTELVTNAVLHGEAPITLRLGRLDGGALRIRGS